MSTTNISIFLIFILVIIPCSFPLSFNFTTIGPNEARHINLTGNATISTQGIHVTRDEDLRPAYQAGRATYFEPVHLWDRVSGNLTSFTTHFSFVIDSNNILLYADGLAFFLAPVNSTIQPWSLGGNLGLGNGSQPLNSSHSFVAVEFDTFANDYDSPSAVRTHVGIDVNSMASVNSTAWLNDIPGGRRNEAWISYTASSMTLTVDFTNSWQNVASIGSLSRQVDLREVLPEYVSFGFSAGTAVRIEKHIVESWEFSSRFDSNSSVFEERPIPGPWPDTENRTPLIVGPSVGLAVLVSGVALGVLYWLKYKKKKKGTRNDEEEEEVQEGDPLTMDMEFEKGSGAKRFPYGELVRATNNFAEEEKLGEGGFGCVYRGFLHETDSYIAVKKISKGSKQGLKEYASEVKIISQLRHRNLVQLVGWCHQGNDLLLVYDFMPNGSLDSHLFKSKSILTWEVRYKIAQGLASALLYLHEEWECCVVHRDVKPSNIMLDSNFNAKLGDFGLARLVDHEKGSQTTVLAGTIGYMAPECVVTGRASKESDVYSFGIVLLEIACGRRPVERRHEDRNRVVLVEWVWSLYGVGKLTDAADPKLSNEFDERELERLVVVGLWCVHPCSDNRPSIRQAIHVLDFEAPLPVIASAPPVATYVDPAATCVELNYTDTYSGGYTVTTTVLQR